MQRLLYTVVSMCTLLLTSSALAETITVSAAASLTNAFEEIGKVFEEKHPGDKISFNFGASGALLQQIIQGAPVDVFASADQITMDKAQAEKAIKNATRINFTGNGLVLVVPIKSTMTLNTLADLATDHFQYIAMGNPDTTPNARYAKAAMQKAGIWDAVEPKLVLAANVRQSLSYVSQGEVEAGFVFSTDAKQDQDHVKVALTIPTVEAGEKPDTWKDSPIIYPIAETIHSSKPLATTFIAFVRTPESQKILARYGFTPIEQTEQ